MTSIDYPRSVVVFAAHPDDAEIFCAGTLKRLVDRGWRATICPVTAGGMGGFGSDEAGTARRRLREAGRAAALLGADFRCLGGRDGYLYDTAELRIAAQALVREAGAGAVIGHLPMDYHPDHRAAAAVAEAAALLATLPNVPCGVPPLPATPLLYHSATLGSADPLGNPLPRPHFLVDVGEVEGFKAAMLACHESQVEIMRVMHGIDDFAGAMREQDAFWGKVAGIAFAEAYWQHLGGGFQKTPLLQEELAEFVRPATG